ncbi:dynein axonemal heavy chain 7-like [Microplitis demolitor]|uniref:dynein axonemal heavy chain 7-like n=1 Tax=Microplitis demolitor TaxID=69319 RepID=UPI00235B6898|nr:dynein axonemal heavy chain 7-like [Microplitis demolitor]
MKNYFLSHNLIKFVIVTARSSLLPTIVNLADYRSLGLLEIADFSDMVAKNIRSGSLKIKHEYYKEVIKSVSNPKMLKNISAKKIAQFMSCLTNLFVQQILYTIMQTIEHIINTIKDTRSCPQINFQLICKDGRLLIDPSMEEVGRIYHQIITDIENIARNLLPFNCSVNSNPEEDYIDVKVPDWFIKKSHDQLTLVIIDLFEPLSKFFNKVNDEFNFVCARETRANIIKLVSQNNDFNFYCDKVRVFNEYLQKANAMNSYVHYEIGRLSQLKAKESLKEIISEINGILVNKLVSYHWQFNTSICQEFEILERKALDVPNNTKALFELTENMGMASKITVEKLEDKIFESVEMLSALLQITSLREEHIELNKRTINWLSLIESIFNQSNTLCEAMKSELEDELQKTINLLNIEVDSILPEFVILDDMDDAKRVHEYIEYLEILVRKIRDVDGKILSINNEEKLFKFPETTFPKVDEMKDIILPFYSLIRMIHQWRRHNSVWMDGPFEYINAEEVSRITFYYLEQFTELNRSMKTKIKQDMTSSKPFRFSGVIDDPDPMQQPAPLKLCFQALEHVKEFKQYVPLVNCMCNPALARRHWTEMSSIYGEDFTPNAGTTLRKIIALDLMKDIDKYQVISISANKELSLQKQLEMMTCEWDGISFVIESDANNKLIFVNYQEIQIRLEEHLVMIQEMKGSYFVKPIAEAVVDFYQSLMRVRDVIQKWNELQDESSFLSPIFANQLDTKLLKADLYFEVGETLNTIRDSILDRPTFKNIGKSTKYYEELMVAAEKIEIINEAISRHLDSVRLIFPRFFFLSNNEIIEILFNKSNFERIKLLMQKCFQGIKDVKLNRSKEIVSILSDHREELLLKEKISCVPKESSSENWLQSIESKITDSVRQEIVNNLFSIDMMALTKLNSPAMITECLAKLFWTSNVQKCFFDFTPTKLQQILDDQNILIANTIADLKNLASRKQRLILMSLITIFCNQKEIVQQLIDTKTIKETDFYWIVQMRFYWQENIKVHMVNASKHYGYEFYTTDYPSLINTPLTDRCYRSIFEADRHHFFGALVGSAATGKVQTIKSLSRALATQFHLINCTKELTFDRLYKIFKGLIACGVWVCFKDINASALSILSPALDKMYSISQIISSEVESVHFEGTHLPLRPGGFIAITLNPGQCPLSYNNLPDNLKVIFRTVAFTRSDIDKVCEINLFAAGFDNPKNRVTKIQQILQLCMDQLSPGRRYDFGYRAVNAIIKTAVGLKFEFPEESEDFLILRSLIDVTLPMLLEKDIIIFQKFIQDIFPTSLPSPNYDPLMKALNQVAQAEGLHVHEIFQLKIIQIFEMMYMRHAFVVVGESLGGKTTILRALAKCLALLKIENHEIGVDVVINSINQNSMTLDNLFGHLDDKTMKWNDGVCSSLLREYIKNDELVRKWLIFDGPINSAWMENLSTLLDDNKILLLPSGEKIQLTKSISIIFETDNLEQASPATLSRCGIVYVEPQSVGWKPHATSWLLSQKLPGNHSSFFMTLLDWSLDAFLDFAYQTCKFIINVSRIHIIHSTLKLVGMYLKDAIENSEETEKDHFGIWSQVALILAIVWSVGSCLTSDSQSAFNEFCLSMWTNNDLYPRPEEIKQFEISLPTEGMIQDNTYIFKGTGLWKTWSDILKTENINIETCGFGFTVVPTVDIIKHINIFKNHINHRIPFVISGDQSTGKTSCIKLLLKNKLSNTEYLTNAFNFSSTITAQAAQRIFLLKINKIKEGHYSPPKNKFCINFVDDLNIIVGENYPGHSLLDLIRQYIDHGYWYSLEKPDKVFVDKVIFLCALTLRHERQNLCSRFLRHFNLYTMRSPSKENIFRIFTNALLFNLKKNQFSADVIGSVNGMINATIYVYNHLMQRKFVPGDLVHQFNLRDISKVVSGCSLIHKESAETKITLIRLWVHESLRIFGDRITSTEDSDWLFLKIKEAVKDNFKDTFESVFDHLPKQNDRLTRRSFKNLIFVNFMDADKEPSSRRYEEITSKDALKNKVVYYLNEFNQKFDKKLDILILSDVLAHLVRVCRVLAIPGGHLLMLCTGGSGRKSLTQLAAFIEKQNFHELIVNPYYSLSKWRNDLKKVLKTSGGCGKDSTYFVVGRFVQDKYLEDISSLMSTGEIPDLISAEERQSIIEIARLPAQKGDRNLEIATTEVMDYFFNQCREKLHFILYYNMSDKNLRQQLKSFPNLLNCCFVDCFMPWPLDAFVQLGHAFIEDLKIDSSVKENIITAGKYLYDESKQISVKYRNELGRMTHVSPSAFIHMMKLFAKLMAKKQQELMESKERYLGGLKKLQLAAQEVTQMKANLTVLRPQLEWSARQTEETMLEIETENVSVENATIQVTRDEEIANKAAKVAATLKSECEAELAVAIPILEDAIAALNTLKPTDITLVKAMKNPPDTVKLVMAAVCVMLGVPAERVIDPITGRKSMDFWGPSKRVLGDMNFLQNLKDYEKDNIPAALMQVVKKTYMTDKSFMPHIVAKASSAAEGLCKWVRAMVSYDEVAKVVAPKKEKLATAERECNEAQEFLKKKQKTLAALNDKLTALNDSLRATLAKKLELENEVEVCEVKLRKAEALIRSLGGEKNKWMAAADCLKMYYDNLSGDLLLMCGIIAYLAPYHPAYRDDNLRAWKSYIENLKISCSSEFNFIKVAESEITVSNWHFYGLPKNRFPVENAVIAKNSLQPCLFIDPQNQANFWIREMEKENKIKILKLVTTDFLIEIQKSIELGQPVLLENIEEDFIASLECILSQNIYKINDQLHQEINNEVINYNSNFRLYLTTRLHNPNFDPYVFRKTTVINFLLPNDALQESLLDIVISRERPELQEKFNLLLIQSASNKKVLKEEEENILTTLSTSTVNILEDEAAIQVLDSSKNLSVQIQEKEEAVLAAKNEIDSFRTNYYQFTYYCATLYNTLSALPNLNCMYKFSLSWFTQLFIKSIANSNRSVVLKKRIEYLKTSFTKTLHSSVLTALFEKHKLVYSFLLYLKILEDSQQISKEEYDFFVSTPVNVDGFQDKKIFSLPEKSWEEIIKLSNTLEVFKNLPKSIQDNQPSWKAFYDSRNPENSLLPFPWEKECTEFQKLIIFKIIRPDKTVVKISQLISSVGEGVLVTQSSINLYQSYLESSYFIPLIFILPSYLEPMKLIKEFGTKSGYSTKLTTVSLGANQESRVEKLISETQRNGGWIFLQNCHLAIDWMPQLEKIREKLDTTNTDLEFRLWLSSIPTDRFPIDILQDAVKITYDAPVNLKQTLINSYSSDPLNTNFFNGCPGKDKIFSKLIYSFSFFHATLRERNYFRLQGWNVNYDFCHYDLSISVKQLQTFLNENDYVPFEALKYIVRDCNYGGKILDDFDKKYLITIFDDFCNDKIVNEVNYSFFTDYIIPNRCEYQDFVKHINKLQNYTPAEVFGVDVNAEIRRDTFIINEFFDCILQLNEQVDDETLQNDVIEKIREKIPGLLDIVLVREKNWDLEFLNAVFIKEIIIYNETIKCINKSLLNNEDYSKLINNLVPCSWLHFPNKEDCTEIWLGAFQFPKRLISAAGCMFARKLEIPTGHLDFGFEILTSQDSIAQDDKILNFCSLYLSGARWDEINKKLVDSNPKQSLYCIDVIRLTPKIKEEKLLNDFYACPLYKSTCERGLIDQNGNFSNNIMDVNLSSDLSSVHWIKNGTAIFCLIE